MRSQRSRWCCCQVGCDSCSTAARIAEPKTVEAKGAVDSQAAVQVEAKSKVMCGGFASVKTAIAESVYDCYCWRLVKEAEVLLRNMSCVRRVRLSSIKATTRALAETEAVVEVAATLRCSTVFEAATTEAAEEDKG